MNTVSFEIKGDTAMLLLRSVRKKTNFTLFMLGFTVSQNVQKEYTFNSCVDGEAKHVTGERC